MQGRGGVGTGGAGVQGRCAGALRRFPPKPRGPRRRACKGPGSILRALGGEETPQKSAWKGRCRHREETAPRRRPPTARLPHCSTHSLCPPWAPTTPWITSQSPYTTSPPCPTMSRPTQPVEWPCGSAPRPPTAMRWRPCAPKASRRSARARGSPPRSGPPWRPRSCAGNQPGGGRLVSRGPQGALCQPPIQRDGRAESGALGLGERPRGGWGAWEPPGRLVRSEAAPPARRRQPAAGRRCRRRRRRLTRRPTAAATPLCRPGLRGRKAAGRGSPNAGERGGGQVGATQAAAASACAARSCAPALTLAPSACWPQHQLERVLAARGLRPHPAVHDVRPRAG